MSNQRYYITDGNNYITYLNGSFTTVGNKNNATQYPIQKANNVIKYSIPSRLKRFKWHTEEVIEEENIIMEEPIQPDKDMEQYEGLTDNILEKMMDFESYIKQLKDYLIVVNSKLLTIQSEIQDIEHAAEFFDDLDLYRGWKLYKMLNDARKRRRSYKDAKAKIEYILNSNFQDCTKNAITEHIQNMKNRTYMPRVYQELFEK